MTHIKTIKAVIPILALSLLLGFGSLAQAQGTTTTPTAPNTGAGGEAPLNLAILGVSGLVALFGASYLIANRTRNE